MDQMIRLEGFDVAKVRHYTSAFVSIAYQTSSVL